MPMTILRKISLSIVLLALIAVLLLFTLFFYQYKHLPLILPSNQRVPDYTIKVPPGTGVDRLVNELTRRKLLTEPKIWKTVVALSLFGRHLKAGEYQITPGMTLEQLLDKIINGQVYVRELVIIEGWRYQDLLQHLRSNNNLKHVVGKLNGRQLLSLLGAQHPKPEGQFFPDTYFYTWGDSDFDLLQQAYAKMQRVLAEAWKKRAHGLPYKAAYQALIAASLIEKETALASERPIVASVIVNRLRKNMPLQIDPTVKYGLGFSNAYRLSRSDLRKVTEFNTYLKKGLPPTPIALPSKASIWAALHPAKTDYLYYVASGNGSGGHKFSRTYRQHLKAVKKYLHNRAARDNGSLSRDLATESQANMLYELFLRGW